MTNQIFFSRKCFFSIYNALEYNEKKDHSKKQLFLAIPIQHAYCTKQTGSYSGPQKIGTNELR